MNKLVFDEEQIILSKRRSAKQSTLSQIFTTLSGGVLKSETSVRYSMLVFVVIAVSLSYFMLKGVFSPAEAKPVPALVEKIR